MGSRARVFELEEANALIPYLESLLAELEEEHRFFQRLHDEIFFEELLEQGEPAEEKLQALENTLARLEERIDRIQSLGCVLRHPAQGLVDFLARRGEEWFYYCWRRGEGQIQFYHALRDGYLDRRPLSNA